MKMAKLITLESRRRKITLVTLLKVAKICNVDFFYLFILGIGADVHVDTKVWTSASSQFSDILKNLAQAYGSKIELNFILLFFNMHIILFPFLFFLNWLCNCSLLI